MTRSASLDAAETVRVANPELAQGTERVVQEGSDGVSTSVYEVVWSNGKQVSRQFVEELESTAVDEIVEYGTAAKTVTNADKLTSVNQNADGSGTLVFASGATLNFSSAKSMTATAYTAGHGRRGQLYRHRHRCPRGYGRGRQERHPAGHSDVYRHQ